MPGTYPLIFLALFSFPSVGSCHHGMARPLGCRWGSRPPDMEVSCEYIEYAVVDSRPEVVLQLGGLA